MFTFHMFISLGLNSETFSIPTTSQVGGNSDSRLQMDRDSEIAPTEYKQCEKQQNYHVTSTSRKL